MDNIFNKINSENILENENKNDMSEEINKEENENEKKNKNNNDDKINKEENENTENFPIEINNFQRNELLASQMLDSIFNKIETNKSLVSENKSNNGNDELKSNEELENNKDESIDNDKNKEMNKNDKSEEKVDENKNSEEVSN